MQSLNEEAQLVGSITGDLELTMIPSDVDLQPGEILLTSGLGGNYPADVVVGQVATVQKRKRYFPDCSKNRNRFLDLRAVLVITNFNAIDIDLLTGDEDRLMDILPSILVLIFTSCNWGDQSYPLQNGMADIALLFVVMWSLHPRQSGFIFQPCSRCLMTFISLCRSRQF